MMTAGRTGIFRAAIVGLALFACSGATTAQSPTPTPAALALAREIIQIKQVDSLYDPIFAGVIERAKFTFMQANPMLQTPLNEVAIQLRADLRPRLDALKEEIARLYAQAFTEQELNQVLAFYKSPLGSKLLKTEPQVFDRGMSYASDWAEKLADEVIAKMRNEMRKRGHEL